MLELLHLENVGPAPSMTLERVELRRRPFVHHGDVSNWLTSEAFDLKEARSREAEDALERARALLRAEQPTLGLLVRGDT